MNESVKVTGVSYQRTDYYYDFTVEPYHNYVMAGVVHHNTGKTWMSIFAIHEHAKRSRRKGGRNGKYRAIVICPNHLITKWCREIAETIPGAIVRRFDSWKDFLGMLDCNVIRRMPGGLQHEVRHGARWTKAVGPEWYIVGRNQIKFRSDTRAIGEPMRGFDGKEMTKQPHRHFLIEKVIEKDDKGNTIYDQDGWPKKRALIEKLAVCPKCGARLVDDNGGPLGWSMMHKKNARLWTCKNRSLEELVAKDRHGETGRDRLPLTGRFSESKIGKEVKVGGKTYVVRECGERLWQYTRRPYRWAMADIIQKKMRGFFRYLIVDECHEQQDATSIQSKAMGKVWSVSDKLLALTGTFINGYADSIYSLLMRMAPRELKVRGFEWGDELPFVEEYGRIDRICTSKGPMEAVLQKNTGRHVPIGKVTRRNEVAPGIMPTLFGHIVMPLAMFITLEELADELPNLTEVLSEGCVDLPPDIQAEYERVESSLARKIASIMFRGGMKLMGTMVQTLLAYPDHPFDWHPMFDGEHSVGYWERPVGNNPELMTKDNWRGVVSPWNFDCSSRVLPKEAKLIEICQRHIAEGSQVWVYVQQTQKRNVMPRLQRLLEEVGIKAAILNADQVAPTDREDWIRTNGDKYQVIISHPKLVSTGLDLFWRDQDTYRSNYNVLVFYETGYNLFDLRQAARRAWRLGRERDCLVYYLYYRNTMQHRAMELMSRKLEAALQLEGSFSEDGLAALSSDSSVQMALCKSISEKIDAEEIKRKWAKIKAGRRKKHEKAPSSGAPDSHAEHEGNEQSSEESPLRTLPKGMFLLRHPTKGDFLCRVRQADIGPYIEATPAAQSPASQPMTLVQSDIKRECWSLVYDIIDMDMLVELARHGFTWGEDGNPETLHPEPGEPESREMSASQPDVTNKHTFVGEVPFETGVPEPTVKSPLDRHSMENQMVAETMISYGLDLPAPETIVRKPSDQEPPSDEKDELDLWLAEFKATGKPEPPNPGTIVPSTDRQGAVQVTSQRSRKKKQVEPSMQVAGNIRSRRSALAELFDKMLDEASQSPGEDLWGF